MSKSYSSFVVYIS